MGLFRSPADSEEIIQLSLMAKHSPRWQVTVDFLGRPTIHPSIWQRDGTCAHFWIRRGNVEWCGDSGRKPRQDFSTNIADGEPVLLIQRKGVVRESD